MIDIKHLRENQDLYKKGFATKRVEIDISEVIKLDEEYRELLQQVEEFRAEKNKVSKLIPTLSDDERQSKIDEMKKLGGKLDEAENLLNKKSVQLKEFLTFHTTVCQKVKMIMIISQ